VGHFRADLQDRFTTTGGPQVIGEIGIPKGTLHRNGMGLRFNAIGLFAGTAGAKTVKIRFGVPGGATTDLVTTSFVTVNNVRWNIEGIIWRCATKQQSFIVKTFNSTDGPKDVVVSTSMTEDETVDNMLTVIGTPAGAGDIITCRVLSAEALG
jgi:hypothetical protein